MDRTIKTRTVIKDIKTFSSRTGTTRVASASAIKLKSEVMEAARTQSDNHSDPSKPDVQRMASAGAQAVLKATSLPKRKKPINRDTEPVPSSARQRAAKEAAFKSMKQTARENKAAQSSATARSPMRAKTAATVREPKTKALPLKTTRAKLSKHATSASQTPSPSHIAAKAHARRVSRTQSGAATTIRGMLQAIPRAATAFARMAMAAARTQAVAIAAVGGSTAAMVVIVCLAGLVATSAFGIFFAGGDMGDGNPSLREAVAKINASHASRIDEIKADNPHDEVALSGSKAPWKEVLSVYAVKVSTDPANPLDVITLDETRMQTLKSVFWDMNSLDSRIEEKTVTEIVLEDDGRGNLVETSKETVRKVLYIVQASKTANDMAQAYGFTGEQTSLLNQLLDKQYDAMWQAVLFGVGHGSGDLVEIAASQIGNVGGAPYWSWYGFTSRVEWCACFVSWCANEAGYIESGTIPKFSYCPTGIQWFKDAGRWKDRGYTPQPGDIIFFDWQGDGISDHVGIVGSCDGSTVFTIEGNSGDACQRNSYNINSSSIAGYGTIMRPQN